MRRVNWNRLLTFMLVWLMVMVLAGTANGQTEDDPPPAADEASPATAVGPGIEWGQAPYTMSYQGYLVNNSGVPLNGAYNLTASLFDETVGGNRAWGPEPFNGVMVKNGQFNLVLGDTLDLWPDVFDRALYLQITVNGVALPRQPLRATPYAYGLLPGAQIVGNPHGGWMLTISSANYVAQGVRIETLELPLYADVTDEGDEAFVTPDYVHARGFRSDDGSYLFAPAMSGVDCDPNAPNLNVKWDESGTAYISSVTTGAAEFCIPVQMPAVLYGVPVEVDEVRIYYRVTSANNYISGVGLFRGTGAQSSSLVFGDSNDLKNTVSTTYDYPTDLTLNEQSGPLMVQFLLQFSNTSAADKIYIGGVRLHLTHLYRHGY